jgi:hypothetical protein
MEDHGAHPAPVSSTTSTAPAAATKVSSTAAASAPDAHSGTTSPPCCSQSRPIRSPADRLVDVLCQADRPESIITWKRSGKIQALLTAVGSGQTPLTHDGLDSHRETAGGAADHLRALLVHHGLLPYQDPYLTRFEAWIDDKLRRLPSEVAKPVEHFAKWHHLHRIRAMATPAKSAQGPMHAAKQEITETIKFLDWLWQTHHRTAATCSQQDVDSWLTTGPTTRKAIRTFFIFAKKTGTNMRVEIGYYTAKGRPAIPQEQRFAWLKELLTGTSESLPYRGAGTLLLLYAQPLVRVAALRTDAININDTGAITIALGTHAVPVPQPFAELLRQHVRNRPNLRTASGADSPWLFPGTRAGHHLHPNTIMLRLRALGIELLGARNTALNDHLALTPPPLVADALGYSSQVAFLHADAAGEPWSRYVDRRTFN